MSLSFSLTLPSLENLFVHSYLTKYVKYVWDFSTSQRNGIINCACLTTKQGGQMGYVVNILEKEASSFIEQGFWFGLSDNGYLYFAVSDRYLADEDNLDWIFEAQTHYPEEGAFNSKILRTIEDLADETELDNYAEYPLFLAYGLKLAQASINHYKTAYPERKIGYSIGYDSGDIITGGWV